MTLLARSMQLDFRETKSLLQRGAARIRRSFLPAQSHRRVVVLCYHSVHPEKRFATSPATFETHLQWVREHCENIQFSRALDAVAEEQVCAPAVAITFDDGYEDNFTHAFPLLQKYEMTATFFVTAGLINNDPHVIGRFQLIRRSSYENIRPMTWTHLREMSSKRMDIGAHTYNHPKLAFLPLRHVRAELMLAKRIIEEGLGQPVRTMAYPYGKPGRHWNRETLQVAADAGYTSAGAVLFRNVREHDCPLAIPRIAVLNDSVSQLDEKIRGAWDLVGLWQETAHNRLARLISPKDFKAVPGFESPLLKAKTFAHEVGLEST